MKKTELVKVLSDNLEVSQKAAAETLKTVFDVIEDILVNGDEVSIPKFGKFSTKVNAARTCRNPKTGDPLEVPEKRVPKFKASSVLKTNVLV